MATDIIMPELGESVDEATVISWLKNVGETVEEYEALLEVETDKVDTEVPSPITGTVLAIFAQPGDVVKAGERLAVVGQPGEGVPGALDDQPVVAQAEAAPEPAPAMSAPSAPHNGGGNGGSAMHSPRISPVVANIAAEHGIPTETILQMEGSGRDGRVTKADMLAYVEHMGQAAPAAAPAPNVAPSTAPVSRPQPSVEAPVAAPADHVHKAPPSLGQPGQIVPLSRMRQRIAEHMVESKLKMAPHVTTVFEADFSAVMAHRAANKDDFAARGINLTFTAYFVAATAHALRVHPMVNSCWTDEGVRLYRDVNIGMAVAIDDGLIVPVVKHADELSLAGIARQVNDLAIRARDGQLQPDEVKDGTFTITNHGVSGSLFATPIINQPQTGILGTGAIQKRVVVTEDDAIAIRPMVYITLTFDHRVLDGASADFFVATVKEQIEGWV